ncbi:MAG TPA: 3-oxoacyl-[acyl-carrier-protein] reductase [Bacteroidota bacterium]|jgi:3-oxoacyl-[acyl-carrier protein] reductase|nr:3-oxoacyl-[acyl-carrier-protein] reductase [Bacteroidota bacterium]
MNLKDKIALVTGGSRGIGKAIALGLADAGAHVFITYRSSAAEAEAIVGAIKKKGCDSGAFQSDAADFNQSKEIVEKIVQSKTRIDILVNNAGITKDGLLMRMTEEDWDAVIDTNLKSVFNLSKAALRPMMGQRSGKIINITSIAGVIGNAGQANYAASKAGVIGFTKSLAKEVGSRNIQVNAVAPGFVETDMTAKLNDEQRKKLEENIPLKRTAKPEEIAGVVRFLASSAADYITGQVICVDGGMVM